MKTEKLNYDLPAELIAQRPLPVRSDSRLLVLNRFSGKIIDSHFRRLGDFLLPGDCLVLNDTKVVPARFFARRRTGARLEGLFLEQTSDGAWVVYLKGARKIRTGEEICIEDRQKGDFCTAVLLEKGDSGECKLKPAVATDAWVVLETIGSAPLPPYIKRPSNNSVDPTNPQTVEGRSPFSAGESAAEDLLNYQTVYAQKPGAVAAPTAGLHFTESLIEKLKQAGVRFAFVTLHVGAGTFKPVTTDNLDEHRMHTERYSIDAKNAEMLTRVLVEADRIIPVGTTSTRVLETLADGRVFKAISGVTDLFIKPGYKFKITDAMITNFHLPKSTLLALVAAFAGLENTMSAYKHAVEKRYRFYSYGDAMLIIE